MRDRCCGGGGAVVAAAVAVIEEQNIKVNRPFLNISSSERLRDSLPRTKEARSPSNSNNQSFKDRNSSSNNVDEGSTYWLGLDDYDDDDDDYDKNQNQASISSDRTYTNNTKGNEIFTDENDKSRINFSGIAFKRTEIRKSNSPTDLYARSKNTTCLEEALGGNLQFSVRNSVNCIDRIVSDRGDFEAYLNTSDGNLFTDKFISFSNKTNQSADHNFEEAVNDFNLTAEDIQNFVSKYDPSKRALHSSTTDPDQETVVLSNQYVQVEKSDRLTSIDYPVENFDTDSSDVETSTNTDSDSDGEHVINEGLATITEEDRATASSIHSVPGGDSSSQDDESTVKGNAVWSGTTSNRESSSDLSTSSSTRSKNLKDSSTRCNDDFQWIPKEPVESTLKKMDEQLPQTKPPINRSVRDRTPRKSSERERTAPGSLDRRRHHHQNRQERDQKSRSSHILKSPPKFDDYGLQNCQNWCCNPHPNEQYCFDNFHRRHERVDPQRYGSSPMLMDQRCMDRGSHPDLYSDFSRFRHEQPYGCCAYHTAPPCCFFNDARNYHWAPPSYSMNKGTDQDEKLRKLQSEKDNLQLQVQVLSEQIEAQGDKITDLEKILSERKQQLASSEDMLQREMLSRSSLETQKLELMSAISEMKLHQASLERENLELRSSRFNNNTIGSVTKPPPRARASPQPQHSTPVHHSSNQAINIRMSPSPSPVPASTIISLSPRKTDSSSAVHDLVQPPKTPPANYRRQIDIHYGSLPRQQFLSNGEITPVTDTNANSANTSRKGVAFGRGFYSLLGVRGRGQSVPNLGDSSFFSMLRMLQSSY